MSTPTPPPLAVLVRLPALSLDALRPLTASPIVASLRRLTTQEAVLDHRGQRLCDELGALVPRLADSAARRAALALRRDIYNHRIPRDTEWASQLGDHPGICRRIARHLAQGAHLAERHRGLAAAYTAAMDECRRSLWDIVARPDVQEMIFFSSPALHADLYSGRAADRGQASRHARLLERGVIRYLLRAAAKATPLHLLCATGLTFVRDTPTTLALAPGALQLYIHLNWHILTHLTGQVTADPALVRHLPVWPNPTLYRDGSSFVFWRRGSGDGAAATEERCTLPDHPVAAAFLEAPPVPARCTDLVTGVQAALGAAIESTTLWQVFERLRALGALSGDPGVPADAPDDLSGLKASLAACPDDIVAFWQRAVAGLEEQTDSVQACPAGSVALATRLRKLAAGVQEWAPPESRASRRLLAVDSVRPLRGALGQPVVQVLTEGLRAYYRVVSAGAVGLLVEGANRRARLASAFGERFGNDRPVSVQAAADALAGVLTGAGAGKTPPDHGETWPEDSPLPGYRRFLSLFRESARRHPPPGTLAVSHSELDELGLPEAGIPPVDVAFRVGARSRAALNRGECLLALEMLSSPGTLTSRFAYLFAHDLQGGPLAEAQAQFLSEWLGEHAGWLPAELALGVQVSDSANAARRPAYFPYRVAVAPPSGQRRGVTTLLPADLALVRSGTSGELELQCPRLGRRVALFYHSAVEPDPGHSLSLLLMELSVAPARPFHQFRRLPEEGTELCRVPRLAFERLLISPARWYFAPGQYPDESSPAGWPGFAAVQRWRFQHGLPRWVFVSTREDPKPMPLDFDSPLAVESVLGQASRQSTQLLVAEWVPAVDELWLKVGGQRRVCEFLLGLYPWQPRAD